MQVVLFPVEIFRKQASTPLQARSLHRSRPAEQSCGVRLRQPDEQGCNREEMDQRCCRFCQRQFEPSPFHREQTACSDQPCQQQRRTQNRNRKLALDAEYRQVCRDSARKWRANHAGYWRQYRAAKPESVERNRTQQQQRDLRKRLADLANNNSALDLKASVAGVWLLGPTAADLANNNLASVQVFILQGSMRQQPLREASCKQQPFGMSAAFA